MAEISEVHETQSPIRLDKNGNRKKTNRRKIYFDRVAKYTFAVFVLGLFTTIRQFRIGSKVIGAKNLDSAAYDELNAPRKRSPHSNVSAASDVPTRDDSARLPKKNLSSALYDEFNASGKRPLHSNVSAASDVPTRDDSARLPKKNLSSALYDEFNTLGNRSLNSNVSAASDVPMRDDSAQLPKKNLDSALYDESNDPGKRPLNSNVSAASDVPTKDDSARLPKTLVIYFPQYHRDPVNDRNWGDNFTDWDSLRSVEKTNRFGQPIPRPLTEVALNHSSDLPPALGWYDLSETKPRQTQGILAKKYDIDGFIYHHYWFYDETNPGPTLAKPLERMLEDGHPDIPFLLNWCAVRWVNVWMGAAIFQKIPTSKNRALTLQEQYFNGTQDAIYQHYLWLKPFFHHPNYIRVDGQPAFMIYYYEPRALPILESLRRYAIEDGFPGLYFIVGRSSHHEDIYDTSHLNTTDKNVNYWVNRARQPRDSVDPTRTKTNVRSIYASDFLSPIREEDSKVKELTWDYNPLNQTMTYPYPLEYLTKPFEIPNWCTNSTATTVASDSNSSRLASNHEQVGHPEIIGVITTFDNTPRRKRKFSRVFMNAETNDEAVERFSESYHAALYYQKCCVSPRLDDSTGSNHRGKDDRFVVINAWNEWAEAMSIEPSDVYGYRWLETIQAVQRRVDKQRCVWE